MRHVRLQERTLVSIGCLIGLFGQVYIATAETVAERFEQAMKKKAEYCATHKIDPANRRCDILKLPPANPLATEEGRFAHSIKIPNPVPADSGYKSGMTSEQYFEHLCKTEAGEFIYKTVENVDGLYMMRPRKAATDYELEHLYALEDPYGHTSDDDMPGAQDSYVQPVQGKYLFLEILLSSKGESGDSTKYQRYYRDEKANPGKKYQTMINGQGVFVPYVVTDITVPALKSRYGYTWRGITRPHDREFGIAGGELIVLDMETNQVLAVRRGFARTGRTKNNVTGVWWLTAPSCPNRGLKTTPKFIQQVLIPVLDTKETNNASR
jgi:hypothetical protein